MDITILRVTFKGSEPGDDKEKKAIECIVVVHTEYICLKYYKYNMNLILKFHYNILLSINMKHVSQDISQMKKLRQIVSMYNHQ